MKQQSTNRSKESVYSAHSTGGVTSHSKESLNSLQSTGGVANRINASNTLRSINGSPINEKFKNLENASVENQAIPGTIEPWNSSTLFQPIPQRKRDTQAADQEENHEQQRHLGLHLDLLKNQSHQTDALQSYFPSTDDSSHARKPPVPPSSLEVRNGLPQTVTNDLSATSAGVRTSAPKDTNLHSEFDVIETRNVTDITSSSVFTKSIGSIFTNINKQVSSAITNLIAGNDHVPTGTVPQATRQAAGPRGALPVCGSELRGNYQNFNSIGQHKVRQIPPNSYFPSDPLTEMLQKNSQSSWPDAEQNQRQPLDQSSSNLIDYSIENHKQNDEAGRRNQRNIPYKPSDLSLKSYSNTNQTTVTDPRSSLNQPLLISSRQTRIPPPGPVGYFPNQHNELIRTTAPVQEDRSSARDRYPQGSSYKTPTVDDWSEERSVSSLPHLRRQQLGQDQNSLFSNKSSLEIHMQNLTHSQPPDTSMTDHYQSQSPNATRSESPSPTTAFNDWNSVAAKKTGYRVLPSTPPFKPSTPPAKPSALNLMSVQLSVDRMPRLLPSPSVPSRVPINPDCINFPHLSASPSHYDLGEESFRRSGVPCRPDSQIRQSSSFTAAAWSDQFGRSFSSQQLRQTGLGSHERENNRARYTSQTLNRPLRYESNKREYQYQPMIEKGDHYRQVRDSMSPPCRSVAAPSECIEISRLRRDNHLASVASLPRNYPMTQNFKPNIKPVSRERIYSSTSLLRRDARNMPEDDNSDSDDEDWC